MNRGGFSVQRVRLPLQSHPYKARGASLPERSTHCRAMFRYALPYISNLKKLVLWYLLLEVFTRTSFRSTEPHNFSFQGALSLDYWVFKVVKYPYHYSNSTL